jgi:uncharacterized protein YlxP (DUF503 family)
MYLPAPDEALFVGVLRAGLRIPGSQSLKQRRHVVRSLRDRVVSRHQAAFAEVGHLEAHGATVIAVSVVGHDASVVRARLDTIRAELASHPEALLVDSQLEIATFPLER